MKLHILAIILVIAILTLGNIYREYLSLQRDLNTSTLISLSVQNGDATLIKSKGSVILVDTGTSDDVVESVRRHLGFFERTIDVLVLTHPDRDHIGGTLGILKSYTIKQIILTGVREPEDVLYQEILHEIKRLDIPVTKGVYGTNIKHTAIELEIIWPLEELWGVEVKDANYHSIVLQGKVGDSNILLTGDIDIKAEQQLLRANLLEDVDILKVGHHGSKTSTHPIFLTNTKPEIGIISSGINNPFGHPHPIVIDNLQEKGVKIRQTALEGDIRISL
jgi:competence protein ComEC